ncbi:tight junction protein ZO-1 isoform X5 [Bradysia coprophila]|uniref:tight junction protein ZO-1 isoform X5 n=1 Tax=Bradysia coprophila TaxID=38358 RepID=UPI00187D924B|nr:tight junction protein ZO-1 isoform X5 [Bradysia coprophila]
MASEEEEVHCLLSRHRIQIIRELNESKLVPVLVNKNILNGSDEELVKNECDCEKKCSLLIDFVSRNGFEKFKEFCYAIETECPQLIEDLINDRLKYDIDSIKDVDDPKKEELNNHVESERKPIDAHHQRASSYSGSQHTPSVATTVRPQSPQIPIQSPVYSPLYVNKNVLNGNDNETPLLYDDANSLNNYSLLCHGVTPGANNTVKKRDKLRHRFSDVGSWGRKRKNKKGIRQFHSMNETIEVLADPVIEDDIFGDRTSFEYHTVPVTRVPGYGFGIAVSGGRDNPHFANGDPSIAVSDVLKGGPAEERLQVNDRIISVNGVSLENVEYATAVQVLRDSGNTVTLVVKRRVSNLNMIASPNHSHQHSHSLVSSTGLGGAGPAQQTIKLVLNKSSKKDDFGLVLGCRLFVKEISSKARDQLAINGYSLQEGDIVTRIHNTNTNDSMSLKEAKKIIDGCKERLNLCVIRDTASNAISSGMQSPVYSHTAQVSNCSNNDDSFLAGGNNSYSAQNLYVQPPTRPAMSTLLDDKSNLTPRGRSRNPLTDVSLLQLDRPSTPQGAHLGHSRSRSGIEEPPRPPPPTEDFYSSRRQLYEDDPLQRSKQSAEPRYISFQKEGSVGIRLTGGNEAGIFVTAVQPGSPASLQGLTPGDKILKVNDMDMNGVTREEAVLFLLSLQDRIDLIVQHCKEEYDAVVENQRGDSFHIKTHFHCDNPTKGEMTFKAGDIFRVVDTLYMGIVGSWQVLRIGRGHQEMQRGVIPNKSRAEELATAQFNATKKEMNASESRTSFFRRRRSSSHRRSKSLSRENWDDVVFSDSISKFPAYERVVLRHPGFVRPVVLFGPVSDLARERLTKDFPDKFTAPLQDSDKSNKCAIVRLSNIRDIMDRGKHALLDITPNAVDRLNYAQFYPIVIFLKADTKHNIKQLRQGIPKSAHKSSKKLFEQCQKLDRVWSHIFSSTIVLSDVETWYRKLRDSIDQLQSGAVWMSETKNPYEHMNANGHPRRPTIDNKYGFSTDNPNPEFNKSRAPTSPNGQGQQFYGTVPELPPRIDRASKPPGGMPTSQSTPTTPSSKNHSLGRSAQERLFGNAKNSTDHTDGQDEYATRNSLLNSVEKRANGSSLDRKQSSLDRSSRSATTKNNGSYDSVSSYDSCNTTQISMQNLRLGPNAPDDLKSVPNANGRAPIGINDSLPTHPPHNSAPLGDVALNRNSLHDHSRNLAAMNGKGVHNSPGRPGYTGEMHNRNSGIDHRHSNPPMGLHIQQRPSHLGLDATPPRKQSSVETKTDYGKYSRNNSVTQADYTRSPKSPSNGPPNVPFKPVPPPKPKNYRPPMQSGQMHSGNWENGEPTTPRSPNGFFYPPTPSHYHHSNPQAAPPPPNPMNNHGQHMSNYSQYSSGNGNHYPPNPPYGMNGNHSYGGPYHHRSPPVLGNLPQHHPSERHALDLAGSREQRGSAFELYRKPQIGNNGHHHNMSNMEPHYTSAMLSNEFNERQQYYGNTPPPLPPPKPKKTFLKSPLVALKRAFLKSTKPLRRQNSLVDPAHKPRPILRRQHSMLENRSHAALMTPEMSHRQYNDYNENMQRYLARHEPFYPRDSNSTYQNMETEAIYGNCGNENYYEQDNLYANRALIELERRAMSQPPSSSSGGRIVRRHSMADRSVGIQDRSRMVSRRTVEQDPPENIYQTRSGAYMMQDTNMSNMAYRKGREDEAIYQSRKEMHRDHLYQSKKEMQQRIHQGRLEAERAASESPVYVTRREMMSSESSEATRDPIYQSRRELKEKGFRTRTQLRDHIYQSRIDAMQSMAEPVYVSKREIKHEPIYESREPETTQAQCGAELCSPSVNDATMESLVMNKESGEEVIEDEDTLTNTNQSDSQKSVTSTTTDRTVIEAPQISETPLSPRANRAHISNIIKRTAPPPVDDGPVGISRTSIETQYTSQASLPIGPPNATSTPYGSSLGLPPLREPSTTRGVFDANGGTLCDNVWNVSITIPQGAIPPNVQQEVYFTVTDPRLSQTVGGPPLDMENGETMLSPLVMCGPQGLEFLVPVTLNIPHCAGRTTSLGLALKATDSEKNLQTNWDNIDLPSNAAAHTVSVKVDHF